MSQNGDDGDRTVFSPNPGGRRPPRPVAPTPPAPAPRAAGGSEGDDWIASRAEPRGAALSQAQALRFDELVAPSANPLLRSAGPLLLLLGRLRVAALQASFASLMEQVAQAVQFFEKDIRQAGVAPEAANTAKYLICATADDIVQNIPTEDRHVWTHHSMLSRFFGERIGGVRFFEELDRLLVDPAANYDVLELQHACLALGFQGRYRSDANGMATLQTRQRNLYETLRRIRPRAAGPLSPHWEGQKLALKRDPIRIPTWAAIGVFAALSFGSFLVMRLRISAAADSAAAETRLLHPETPIALQRRAPSPPPPPTAPQIDQLGQIRGALAPEIASGALSVELSGRWIVIRVGSLILFKSGSADVLPQFAPVAEKVAQLVEKQAGPIRIVGHTDNVPLSPANRFGSNFNLSVARAKAVAAMVAPRLSDPNRIVVAGKGPDEPIASNATAEGRDRNRRVEIMVTRAD